MSLCRKCANSSLSVSARLESLRDFRRLSTNAGWVLASAPRPDQHLQYGLAGKHSHVSDSGPDQRSIHHISRPALAEQAPRFVRLPFSHRRDVASSQEPPEQRLPRRAADLGHHGCGHERNDFLHQPHPVLQPDTAIPTIGRHENTSVVRCPAQALRRTVRRVRSSARTSRRAWFTSSSVNAPNSFSYSATPTNPAPNLQCVARRLRCPCRHAYAVFRGCGQDAGMNVWIDSDS